MIRILNFISFFLWMNAVPFSASAVELPQCNVNDFIFTLWGNEDYSDLSASLKLLKQAFDQGEIPLKFSYLGEGAKKYAAVSTAKQYQLMDTEIELIRTRLDEQAFSQGKMGYVMVDIGAGDGQKAVEVISHLKSFHSQMNINVWM